MKGMELGMPHIIVEGVTEFDAPEGQRLVLAIEDAGVDILHRCGGHARCTTCRVSIIAGNAGEMLAAEDERLAHENNLEPNVRLSCQVLAHNDLTVRVLRRLGESGLSDPGPRPSDELLAPDEE